MSLNSPDQTVLNDDWSDLTRHRSLPDIDFERMCAYRLERLRSCLRLAGAAMCVLTNPVAMRYAVDYRNYALFQSHIPTAYLFVPVDGPVVLHGGYDPSPSIKDTRAARATSYFNGGKTLVEAAGLLAGDVVDFLKEIGTDNRRVAIEYVNPSITQALMRRGLDVIDGVSVSEEARAIKCEDEIACMKWAIAVAEHGVGMMTQAMKPGVTELQLWALINYTNVANNGDWHDGRMLASGPRVNPWCQEASSRRLEPGDLVGVDTDMIGPFGYFADVSRTFHCGPGKPSRRQKQLYRLAVEQIEHNLGLIRPGVSYTEFQQRSYSVAEEFQHNAYSCIIHGVGMCDEFPHVIPAFRGVNCHEGAFQAGMVICVESYMGAVGERDGVKLEQQVLVTEGGYELLTTYPFDEILLD